MDCEGTTNVWECGQRTDSRESLGDQAVDTIGTCNIVPGSLGIPVKRVDANRFNVRVCDGKECCERDDGENEFHDDVMKDATWLMGF